MNLKIDSISMKPRITIITNIISSYREGFYDRILSKKNVDITVYCQDNIRGTNLKSIHHKYGDKIHIVKSVATKNEKIGFQFLPVCKIVNESDIIFLDGNPRILSNIIMGFITLFFKNKRVVMWSMAHSFGANKFTENIRLKWTSLYKNIFVYTDKDVETLRSRGFKKQNIIGMNNGLDQTKIDKETSKWTDKKLNEWKQIHGLSNKIIILSSARLVPKNKYKQVVEALPIITRSLPNVIWCLIGTGQEEKKLKHLATLLKVDKNIHFVGEIYNEEVLAPFFISAQLFVHPASIGLSIMHAFGYGLPVIVNPDNQMHGPEYGAFINNETGRNFKKDDIEDLAKTILDLLNSPSERERMRINVLRIARKDYNIDVMVDRFLKMALDK